MKRQTNALRHEPTSGVDAESTSAGVTLRQLHVNIPTSLHRQFRIKVLEDGRSMNQVIEELILDYLRRA